MARPASGAIVVLAAGRWGATGTRAVLAAVVRRVLAEVAHHRLPPFVSSQRDATRAQAAQGIFSGRVSSGLPAVRPIRDHADQEASMKYMLLIHHGDASTPDDQEAWSRLSEDEQKAVAADYQAVSQTPGVTPGVWMDAPETSTTVRVQDGRTLTTDGPFVTVKEALGGYLIFEADDLDAAIELAARIPAARMGGAVEVRPVVKG
jgi:hypothetical protein